MCTLTWETFANGYELHFNRDESRARAVAEPPKIFQKSSVSIIAPKDPEAGGSWISLNHYGFSLCLLNNYRAAGQRKGKISRGLLVTELSILKSSDEARRQFSEKDISAYSPFDLFLFSVHEPPLRFSWNGEAFVSEIAELPFASSSGFDTQAVISGRTTQFSVLTAGTLTEFHRSHVPQRSAYSVCMHRPDAKTLSYSKIRVDRDSCTFWYADGSPCETDIGAPISLPRVTGPGSNIRQSSC